MVAAKPRLIDATRLIEARRQRALLQMLAELGETHEVARSYRQAMEFDYDRFKVDQVVRPLANLYRVTPLAAGETPAGQPIAYVRQKKLAIKEDIRFYSDEEETREVFRIKARSYIDTGSSRYDVFAGEEKIGMLWHKFRESLTRTTWHVGGPDEAELAIARERSQAAAIIRRVIDFVPDVGGFIPIPYNFDILAGERVIGTMNRKFQVRDRYVLDLSSDQDRVLDRRLAIALAIGLDTLQNR
jgi:hypothetical protein